MLNQFIDDVAKTAKEALQSLEKAPADAVIAQVCLIAKYCNDTDVGIPWNLWLAYVHAIEGRQVVSTSRPARIGLSAPVIGTTRWVYPVIK